MLAHEVCAVYIRTPLFGFYHSRVHTHHPKTNISEHGLLSAHTRVSHLLPDKNIPSHTTMPTFNPFYSCGTRFIIHLSLCVLNFNLDHLMYFDFIISFALA